MSLHIWELFCMGEKHLVFVVVCGFGSVSVLCEWNVNMHVFLFQCPQQGWPVWLAHAPPPLPASPPWIALAAATTSTAYWRAAPPGLLTVRLDPRPWRSPARPSPPPAPSHSNLCAPSLSPSMPGGSVMNYVIRKEDVINILTDSYC